MTRFYNFFRTLFKVPLLERQLARVTRGKEPDDLICKLVPNPYQYPKGTHRVFSHNGISMCVDISDYIGHYLYFGFRDKSYESLFNLCKPGFNVLDVGVNIGFCFLMLKKIVGRGNVAGFEPDPLNYTLCQHNLQLNDVTNGKVYNLALGADNGVATMEVRTPGNRGANRIQNNEHKSAVADIKIMKLDDFQKELQWSHYDLIKIDVEGYELKVLRGAESLLRKHHPILFIEVNDENLATQNDSAIEMMIYLKQIGYHQIQDSETGLPVDSSTDFIGKHLDIIAR
jgi:FkbM family methyltransferase